MVAGQDLKRGTGNEEPALFIQNKSLDQPVTQPFRPD